MRANSGSSSFASARLEKSYSSENSILEARSDSGVKRQAAAKRLNGPRTRLRSIASPGRLRFKVVNDWRRPRTPTVRVARVPAGPRSAAVAATHQGRERGEG